MKKNLFRIGLIIVVLTLISTVTATSTITGEIASDITIKLDGKVLDLRDANDNKVYPVVIDGTTYLPLRAISNAFNKDVGWNGGTRTITIGESNEYADLLSVTSEEGSKLWGSRVSGEQSLTFDDIGDIGVKYQKAVKLNDVNSAEKQYSLKLNGQFSKLNATILFRAKKEESRGKIRISNQDGIDFYSQEDIKPNELIKIVELDISGAKVLTFHSQGATGGNDIIYVLNPEVK